MKMSTGRLMEVTRVGCAKRGVVSQTNGAMGQSGDSQSDKLQPSARSNQKGGNKEKKGH
jgi:hypothetical protein